eukprot:CAMPEP_0113387390 /NCGR_PEP_ID=MMETSP0013_2-20120614/8508_1 /TAXON_ID=2843 ORGANISM="Skeletonema costatum, Strain 1716" /NCGR_SAMPLE_ID=MMETSP0013_2 /ASSEMBLY_ACC=CAM_ASM_000158 /LENGTH=300 /DNA_ID=CAMNT_0000270277 /DNA_START=200 /DNA_END=1102 /DNA_ORIENTATION=- /assembly_acc=CAM_ASM_000158
MSEENEAVVDIASCASCGVSEEVDDVKLKECDDCDLVRYCSDDCEQNHISQHAGACKKRAVELRDELLFKQPESSHLGDCPICCLPVHLDLNKATMMVCCSKLVCDGCDHANQKREAVGKLERKCPFCRKPIPSTMDEVDKQMMKRIEANDPVAMRHKGLEHAQRGVYQSAFEHLTKAAELGDITAHHSLSCMYHNGQGVEKDRGKEIYHMEEAAIGGHPKARHNLGCIEEDGNEERAVKHWIIAAAQGNNDSIKALMNAFRRGFVSKDDLAAALRAHQAAVEETKSPQREAADRKMRSP